MIIVSSLAPASSASSAMTISGAANASMLTPTSANLLTLFMKLFLLIVLESATRAREYPIAAVAVCLTVNLVGPI